MEDGEKDIPKGSTLYKTRLRTSCFLCLQEQRLGEQRNSNTTAGSFGLLVTELCKV